MLKKHICDKYETHLAITFKKYDSDIKTEYYVIISNRIAENLLYNITAGKPERLSRDIWKAYSWSIFSFEDTFTREGYLRLFGVHIKPKITETLETGRISYEISLALSDN